MLIGLDWDNTFTANTKFWERFIQQVNDINGSVYITTARGPDTPIEYIPDGLAGIIYCDYKAKKEVTERQGIEIDIWIDDDPMWIVRGT